MELIIHDRDDISYVTLEGRLDATGVEEIEDAFTEATAGRELPTIVELAGISFMSSLGIGFLYANTKRLKKTGCKLVLLNPKGMVEAVLRTSKMDKVMPITYEMEEALKVILGDAAGTAAAAAPKAPAEPEAAPVAPEPGIRLKLAIKNEISALKDLYAQVEEFLQTHSTPYRSGYTVNLALEELVVNVIRYAYMDYDEHLIDVELSIVDEQLILVIEDDGRPFDPREGQALNPHLEEPEVGGLGLVLVLEMVDLLKYERVGDKNRSEVRVHVIPDDEVPAGDELPEREPALQDETAAPDEKSAAKESSAE